MNELNVKTRYVTLLAWTLFGVILVMSLVSIVIRFPANQWDMQNIDSLVGNLLWGLIPIEFAFVAVFIIARQPRNTIGWLLMGPAVALANDGSFHAYFDNLPAAPTSPSLGFILALWFYSWSWILLIFPVFLILMYFPTGRPVSSRWEKPTLYVIAMFTLSFFLVAFQQRISPQNLAWDMKLPWGFIPNAWVEKISIPLLLTVLLSSTILSAASIIVRYKKGSTVEREQIKWLLFATVFFAGSYIIAIFQNLNTKQWGASDVFLYLTPLSLMLMPVAIAIAVLRYRLWDIDILIRKTLVYSFLTGLLGLVYFGIVALLQGVVASESDQTTAIVVVITTLLVAALFNPLRYRLQNVIDRRFYRQKYDAEKALEGFAAVARNETSLPTLTQGLIGTVQNTVQPEEVILWLKS